MPSFAPLLRPLITPQTLPNMLTVILLDWAQPWLWLRQLRDWIRLLRLLLVSLDDATKETLEEHRASGRGGGQAGAFDGGGTGSGVVAEGDVTIPLGPGEWDEALGIPLCVVCQNVGNKPVPFVQDMALRIPILIHTDSYQADKIETLEKERAWKEEEFDFILQFLRTVLLKRAYQFRTQPYSI
jgi:dynein light intermediate chain 1, cytosolic